MISFLKKLLFCVSFTLLFSQSYHIVTAQSDTSSEMTYDAANKIASDVFNTIFKGFAGFKSTYETRSNDSDRAIAKNSQIELEKLAPKYDRLMDLLVSIKTAYDTELESQKQSGAEARDAHVAAANAANNRWVAIKTTEIRSLLMGNPALNPVIREFFNKSVQDSLFKFKTSAIEIQKGASPSDEGIKDLTDPSIKTAADAVRNNTAGKIKYVEPRCSLVPLSSVGECLQVAVAWIFRTLFVQIPMHIFYFCGVFLHFSISFGLETMKDLVNKEVYNLWLFTRNLILAASLFSFLYFIGMVIVGLGSSIQRAAASVILFALFSGFSFSLSTYLIDASNLVTISLYNSIDSNWSSDNSFQNPSIAWKFIQYLGYNSIADIALGTPDKLSILGKIGNGSWYDIIALNLIVGLTLLYNAYTVFMMGIIFLVRDLGLLVGIIFSPLLFVDQAVTKLSEPAKKFRKFFFNQLAIGPVFMFLMYLGIKISDVVRVGVNDIASKPGVGATNTSVIIFNIFIITGVFYYAYKTCKDLSGAIVGAALGAVDGLAQKALIGTALGAAGQATSFVGKNTVGRVARHASREEGFLYKNQERLGFLGKGAFNAMNYAGNRATYDFNNSKVFAGAAQKMGLSGAVGGGFTSKTLGYADARQAAMQQAEKHAKDTSDPEIRQKLVNDSLEKFRKNNVSSSKVDTKDFGKMQAQARKFSVSGQRSSLTDQVNDINFEDLHSADEKVKTAALEKLKGLHSKAEMGGEEIKKWFTKYTQNKILTETTNAIKDDETLNPESPTFNAEALKKYKANLESMLSAGLGLDKMIKKGGEEEKEAKKISEKMVERLEIEIDQIVTEKKRRVTEKMKVNQEYDTTKARANDLPIAPVVVSTTSSTAGAPTNEALTWPVLETEVYDDLVLNEDAMASVEPSPFAQKKEGDGVGQGSTSTSRQNDFSSQEVSREEALI